MDEKQKKYRVKVDRDLCIGAAACIALAPKVFQLDSENKAVIARKDGTSGSDWTAYEELSEEEARVILESAQSCPVDAIVIEDDQSNQIYPQ